MSPDLPSYHQRVAEEKRSQILEAATALFLELGYDRTSLARIAERSGVSRATLFKQFPTKAALFDAMITTSWSPPTRARPRPRRPERRPHHDRRPLRRAARPPRAGRPVPHCHRRAAALPRTGGRAVLARQAALLRGRPRLLPRRARRRHGPGRRRRPGRHPVPGHDLELPVLAPAPDPRLECHSRTGDGGGGRGGAHGHRAVRGRRPARNLRADARSHLWSRPGGFRVAGRVWS